MAAFASRIAGGGGDNLAESTAASKGRSMLRWASLGAASIAGRLPRKTVNWRDSFFSFVARPREMSICSHLHACSVLIRATESSMQCTRAESKTVAHMKGWIMHCRRQRGQDTHTGR